MMVIDIHFLISLAISHQYTDDTFRCSSVPSVRQCTLFPSSCYHITHSSTQPSGILADEYVTAHFYGFNMFRVTVECGTRYIIECSRLGHIAAVRNDTTGMSRKIAKLQITLWSHDT